MFDTRNPSLWSRGRGQLLIFCWLGWVFDLYDLILFSFTKRAIANELNLSLYGDIAWIEGWSLLATAVGGFAFGRIADRRGPQAAMIASIVLYSLGALLTGFADGYATLLFARVVTGLGVGGEWGIGHALVAEHWHATERDRVHGILQAGSPVAMAMAALVGCLVAPVLGWRFVFLASCAPALLALWGRHVFSRTTPLRNRPVIVASSRELWSPVYRKTSAVLLGILSLHMAGFWCVYAELPAALMQMHHVAPQQVAGFQVQINAVHLLADVAFGYLAASFGSLRLFVISCVIFAIGQGALLFWLEEASRDFTIFTLAVAAMGIGAGTWSCFGGLFGRLYPTALRATAAATFYALARGIQLPLKPLMGAAFEQSGSFAPALVVGVVCALLSAGLVLGLRKALLERSIAKGP